MVAVTKDNQDYNDNPPAQKDRSARLAKSWQPQQAEATLYDKWLHAGYFQADATSDKPPFSVVLPPPNVTGQLHMGHALDHTLIDSIIRRKRMQGFETLWLPGTDHAGIATQTKVEAQLKEREGKTRWDYSREDFIDKVWEWKEQYGGTIQAQMRSIGNSMDWSRERFTLDEGLSRAVQTIFKQMYDAGMIYRAHRLVNWSPKLETAVSDIEVVHKDVEGELVSIRYGSLEDSGEHLIVATTRVETMLGDVAIAVHPEDDRYRDLVGKHFEHPFIAGRTVEVIADDYVDPEFGSGAVKITPAHDQNDYAMGQRHNLDMPTVLDTTGHIANTGTQFDGLDRFAARVAVREELAKQGRIVAEKRPYVHSVGHSERTGEPVEPRLSLQWFVKVDTLAAMAGDAIRQGDTTVHPKSMEPRYFDWVDDMHDWTISRQLWWGHRIPIWYGPEDANGERDIVCVGPDETAPAGYEQDPDVLDTWFSSALWPFSTMGWPEKTPELEKFYPTSVLVTAYDILFFWVARMMMFGTFVASQDPETFGDCDGRPQVPFEQLYLHGLVRDEHGRKMSKSLGNGIDPMDWVRDYGADALRFTLARGANPGVDLPVGDEAAEASKRFVTKLYNATKFALMNGAVVDELPARDELSDADRWILDRVEEVRVAVDAYLDDYQFAKANEMLYHFAWGQLCDWYLEIAKTQIPREGSSAQGRNTQVVLGRVLDVVMRLLHPTMPFVTEELWTALTERESVVIAPWPSKADTNGGVEVDERAARRIADAEKLITELRRFRADQGVKPSQKIPAAIDFAAADLQDQESMVRSLANVEAPAEDFNKSAAVQVRLTLATVTVEVDTSGAVDVEAERARLGKDLSKAEKELAQTSGQLKNEKFVSNAPADVVDKIRQRHKIAHDEVERLSARLEALQK